MASIFMRFPGGRAKALTLSYDDGVEQDIRLIGIMQKHGLKGTFNINSGLYADEGTVYPEGELHRRLTKRQAMELYGGSGMEVAVHGLTHPFLEQLPAGPCLYEIAEDRKNLEEQFGTIVRGMAYPYGTYNDAVINCMKASGIVYARTVISTLDFGMPADWLHLKATCHHNHPKLMELAERFIEQETPRSPWMFYLWGHSYEFEQHDNWNVMEDFAAYMGGRENVWYATNMEIYEYVTAYEQLVFSLDGKQAHNPTAKTLYFQKKEKLYTIKPDETLIGI